MYRLTWYDGVFSVIVETTDGEMTAQCLYLDTVKIFGHVGNNVLSERQLVRELISLGTVDTENFGLYDMFQPGKQQKYKSVSYLQFS